MDIPPQGERQIVIPVNCFFEKQFCIIFVFWFAPNDSLFVRSFILALRVANLSSSRAGRSAFRSFIKYIITRYFMRYSTGKILCLILRSVVLSNVVLLKHAFNPQFSCLFRVTRSDFLRPRSSNSCQKFQFITNLKSGHILNSI